MNRVEKRSQRIEELISEFPSLVDRYDRIAPFKRAGQLDLHRRTIAIRLGHSTAADALADDQFVDSLYTTLQAWGIGVRASVLVPIDRFSRAIRHWTPVFTELDVAAIDDPDLDSDHAADLLWELISGIDIVENRSKIVALSKTIHHILPDLLPPIDRTYTQRFFLWQSTDFQDHQEHVFRSMWRGFVTIAQETEPATFVGDGWRTSRTKVIDNAIVAYVKDVAPTWTQLQSRTRVPTDPALLMSQFTVQELYGKLDEFRTELDAAGLKPNSVDTYVGRSTTFVNWLAGRYVPRGPNTRA